MHHGVVQQHLRGHSKDGTPLPRMSVGVSSPRSQYSNGQYVNMNYPHGAVTANSPQERTAHSAPTGGLKTVKGKTVPIPTDPQQILTSTSQVPAVSNAASTSSVNSSKKQKRKKQRSDLASKSPTEQPNKVLQVNPNSKSFDTGGSAFQEQPRIKQEHPSQSASASAALAHPSNRGHLEAGNLSPSGTVPPQAKSGGNVKAEIASPETNMASTSRTSGHSHQANPVMPRPGIHAQTEISHRDQVQSHPHATGDNKSNSGRMTRVRTPEQGQFMSHVGKSTPVEEKVDSQLLRDTRGRNFPTPSVTRNAQDRM